MKNRFHTLNPIERLGHIEQCIGLKVIANGPPQVFVGELCDILDTNGDIVTQAEVIGFNKGQVFLMPFSSAKIAMGYSVRATGMEVNIPVSEALLGQVVDAFGTPLFNAEFSFNHSKMGHSDITPSYRNQINPLQRERIHERLHTGIHAIDALLPIGKGQRIGLFAGSGVGKSQLLGLIAKQIESDINVIALIGERGREVRDFIHQHLDESTLKKSVVVVACSDDYALMRKQAAYTATAIAEYFCHQGKEVMLFMDSITRFAMAQREIGLSLGEPPTARGYTPTVFASLPGLIERAGNFINVGSITALYTVLVEGDDFNEPIADHMRSLLDGHIVLTRALAHRGHYPAIDVLQSISRLSSQLTTPIQAQLIKDLLSLLSLYRQNKELIELGAYQPGHHPKLDHAVSKIDSINAILAQGLQPSLPFDGLIQELRACLQ